MLDSATTLFPQLKSLLAGKRFILSVEKQLQVQLMSVFAASKEFSSIQREYNLAKVGTVDFFIAGTAIEVKITGGPMRIHRQLKRYSEHPDVKEIILITVKGITLPETIADKPAYFIHLSKSWL